MRTHLQRLLSDHETESKLFAASGRYGWRGMQFKVHSKPAGVKTAEFEIRWVMKLNFEERL